MVENARDWEKEKSEGLSASLWLTHVVNGRIYPGVSIKFQIRPDKVLQNWDAFARVCDDVYIGYKIASIVCLLNFF